MAQSWHAAGPVQLYVASNVSNPAYVAFAKTDNEDLVGFEIEDIHRRFTRNDLGDMTAEIVTTGSVCHITFTTTYWAENLMDDILSVVRTGATGATEGVHAEVGALMVSGGTSRLFGFKILTSAVGEKSYIFDKCCFASPIGHREFGNTMQKRVITLEALPDGSGNFYTVEENS